MVAGPQARLRGVLVAREAARPALGGQHQQHQQHQRGGELRRRDRLAEREPGAIDAGGEGVDAEVLHRAEVGQRLHQRERHAAGDRRPGERHRDLEEAAPRPAAQRAADVDHAGALLEEGGAREQVDVGVEHQRHDRDRATERADRREPVVGPAPVHDVAQEGLHRAGELQKVGVGVADDVGRDRERQQQRPLEDAAPGEVAHADQPGGADPDRDHPEPDAGREQRGVGRGSPRAPSRRDATTRPRSAPARSRTPP